MGERYKIKILDLKTKKYLEDSIDNVIGSIVWHENGRGFFYTPVDKSWQHRKLMYHSLSDDISKDKLIFEEQDKLYSLSIGKSSDKSLLIINIRGHDNNEIKFINMLDQRFNVKTLCKRVDGIVNDVDYGDGYFYLSSNKNHNNFEISRAKYNKNIIEEKNNNDIQFKIIFKAKDNLYLNSFDINSKYILIDYTERGLPRLFAVDINNSNFEISHDIEEKNNNILRKKEIRLPDNSGTGSIYSTNYKNADIKVSYSSPKRPSTSYSYNFEDDKLNILKIQEIPSGFNPDLYQVERIYVKSTSKHDYLNGQDNHVMIPVTILYKKSLFKKDGSNPCYIYGYGSYGIAINPSFSVSPLSLVDRGFIYAIAHIRGGDDLGYDWYTQAKFLTKKRTFTDFIDVTKKLIEEKYTSKNNIVIKGGSAGGMLIGNVINECPSLYRLAILHVPFVDVMNTMTDTSLPLTEGEFKEWGDPREKDYFDYMLSYSPYDNITKQNYPHIYVTAGLSDPRVGYFEATKYVARLRDKKLNNNILLLKTNMSYGHQGASGRLDSLKEVAEDITLTLKIFNIEEKIK
ncbi:MAG TPA: prolyl oligopeptidase family serine peptidase [Candidatus Megaira endosymbiont of Hartmannula sinica]|nr:prolyl oligopeptidase family serine peptidase [Candidatus Megaera endosymbiont of Hartmannula sinica]